jgi:hypothetical protein
LLLQSLEIAIGSDIVDFMPFLVQHENNAILYVPLDKQFTCDALLLPPTGSDNPIVVIDISIVDPYHTSRSAKYKQWHRNLLPLLKEKFVQHEVVFAVVWPYKYTAEQAKSRISNANFLSENKTAMEAIYLLEQEEMKKLCVEIQYT